MTRAERVLSRWKERTWQKIQDPATHALEAHILDRCLEELDGVTSPAKALVALAVRGAVARLGTFNRQIIDSLAEEIDAALAEVGQRVSRHTISPALRAELEWMFDRGFKGLPVSTVSEATDGDHTIRIVRYFFPSCEQLPLYVEVEEHPDHSSAPARIIPLGDAVHLLQNHTKAERWAISGREPEVSK